MRKIVPPAEYYGNYVGQTSVTWFLTAVPYQFTLPSHQRPQNHSMEEITARSPKTLIDLFLESKYLFCYQIFEIVSPTVVMHLRPITTSDEFKTSTKLSLEIESHIHAC
jgi:hypothetical protein